MNTAEATDAFIRQLPVVITHDDNRLDQVAVLEDYLGGDVYALRFVGDHARLAYGAGAFQHARDHYAAYRWDDGTTIRKNPTLYSNTAPEKKVPVDAW